MSNPVCEKCLHQDVCILHEDNFMEDAKKNGFCGKFLDKYPPAYDYNNLIKKITKLLVEAHYFDSFYESAKYLVRNGVTMLRNDSVSEFYMSPEGE